MVTLISKKPHNRVDKEMEEFRGLMEVPSTFEEGFNWKSLVGAIFIAIMMVPGAIYMSLLAGQGIGPAAQWVTVILFVEVARRAQQQLKRPEIFVLFYMAGAAMGAPFFWTIMEPILHPQSGGAGDGHRCAIAGLVRTRVGFLFLCRAFLLPCGLAAGHRSHCFYYHFRQLKQHDPRLRAFSA